MRSFVLCLFFLVYHDAAHPQETRTVICYLQNEAGQAISHGTITVRHINKEEETDSLFFLRTAENGQFNISFPIPVEKVVLEINSLGYSIKEIEINNRVDSPLFITLEERSSILDEINVTLRSGIVVESDTIRYDVEHFSDNNENKVEELLSKLPGMRIDEHGNIRHNNRLISRVMLDGDDLFNEGYKMLTKNLSASVIGEIDVISNYHPNPLLSQAGEGKETILNLRLKNRNQILHEVNAQIGQGIPEGRHHYSTNYIGITSFIKGVVLASANNVGQDPINFVSGENDRIIRTRNKRLETAYIPSLFSFDSYRYSRIPERMNNFNKAQMLSANFLFNLHPDLSLKTNISFVKDRKYQHLENIINILDIDKVSLYDELFQLRDSSRFLHYGLEATWTISDKSRLYYNGRFRSSIHRQSNTGELASRDFEQHAIVDDRSMEQRLQFTQAVGDHWVFDSEVLYYHQRSPSTLYLKPALIFEGIRGEGERNYSQFVQILNFPVEQFSVANRLLGKVNQYTYAFSAGYHHQTHDYTQTLEQYEYADEQPFIANHFLSHERFQLGAEFKTNFNSQLSLSTKLEPALEQVQIGRNSPENTYIPTFDAHLSLIFQTVKNGTWALNYVSNRRFPPMIDFIPEYRVLNYRTAQKGLPHVMASTNNMMNLSYGYADYSRSMLITNFTLGIGSNARSYLSHTDYNQYYQLTSLIEHEQLHTPYFVAMGKIEKYIRGLQGNIYLDVEYLGTKVNSVRNAEYSASVIHNTSLDFGLKTAWDNLLNIQLSLKPRMTHLDISSHGVGQSYNTSYLETSGALYFSWTKQFNSQITGSYFMLPDMDRHTSLFLLDFKTRYIFKKDKLFLDLSATNIWNERTITFTQYNQWQQNTRTYRLIPNNYMISVYYAF